MKQVTYRIDVKLIRPDGTVGCADPTVYGASITGRYNGDDPSSDAEVGLADNTTIRHHSWSSNVVLQDDRPYVYNKGRLQFHVRRKPTRKDLQLIVKLVDVANGYLKDNIPADVSSTLALVSKIEVTRVTVTTAYEKVKIPDVV